MATHWTHVSLLPTTNLSLPTAHTSRTNRPKQALAAVNRAACPACGQPLLDRVHRRKFDRVVSLFRSVRRYRCFACSWEGLRPFIY
jgi:hypothetical protein